MQVPSQAELEQFFGTEQASTVQFVETVASWPSLRILDYLFENEPAGVGDIARSLNMDMRDVKDRLDALEQQDIVKEDDDGWTAVTEEVTIRVARDKESDGLDIAYTIGAEERASVADSVSEEKVAAESKAPSEGVVTTLRQLFSSIFR